MAGHPFPLTVEGSWKTVVSAGVKNKLHIYFQSKKKSCGGDCIIQYDDLKTNIATVFFQSEDVRNSVLEKRNHEITIDKETVQLRVSLSDGNQEETSPESINQGNNGKSDVSVDPPDLESMSGTGAGLGAGPGTGPGAGPGTGPGPGAGPGTGPGAGLAVGEEGIPQSTAVVLQGIPDTMSKEVLGMIVESVGHLDEDHFDLELISEINTAVVTFRNPNDVGRFLDESMTHKKFRQHGLTGCPLEMVQCVRVENLTPVLCNTEMLELYFERWGGQVKDCTLIPEEHAAIVTFEESKGAVKTLKRANVISSVKVDVYPYYKSLGTVLYGKERPLWKTPDAFTKRVHTAVWKFLVMKKLFSVIDDQMKTHFCQVNMDSPEARLSPLPSLIRQRGLTAQQLDQWKDNASDAFCNILARYSAFECTTNAPAWKAVETEIRSVVKQDAVLVPDFSRGTLTIAGLEENLRHLKRPVENIMGKALSKIERQSDGIREEVDMPPAKFNILQQMGIKKAVAAISAEMHFSYVDITKKLVLSGLAAEVLKVRMWILERELEMKKKQLDVDPVLVDFLKSVDSMEMSQDLFTSRGISAVYHIEGRGIHLTGSSEGALTEAEKRLKGVLFLYHINIEDEGVLKMPEWKTLNNQLLDSCNTSKKKTVVINLERGLGITVSGFLEPVKEVSSSLEDFVKKYSRVKESVRVKSCAVAKFIEDNKSQDWKRFAKPDEVKVHFDPRRPRIFISGARLHVKEVMKAFRSIAADLCTDELKIMKPGAKKYFLEQGSMFLPTVMREYSCVVLLQENHMLDDEEEEEGEDEDEGFRTSPCCEVRTASGVLVSVTMADICKFRADAVVNAANEDLKHIGGLALALLRASGPQLQKLSDDHISKYGQLSPGDAVVTDAGNLPCKHVIHAVGPRFTDSDRFTAVCRLKKAVTQSLSAAERMGCSSVAVPAVSSGIFGFPLDICSDTIAKAVREFCDTERNKGSLAEIHLVDNDAKRVTAMANAIQIVFGDRNPRMDLPKQRAQRGTGYRGRGQRGHQHPGFRGQSSWGGGDWEQGGRGGRGQSSWGGGDWEQGGRGGRGQSSWGGGDWEQGGRGGRGQSSWGGGDWEQGGRGGRGQSSWGGGDWEQGGRGGRGRGKRGRGGYNEGKEAAGSSGQRGQDRQFEREDREDFLQSKRTQEGMKIVLRKGNIQEQHTDIIVNTIAENVDLGTGAVSNAILQAAGPQLQSAARDEAGSGRLTYGKVLVTDGFNLRCRRVFHAVCPPWDHGAGQAEEALRTIIRFCLKEAEKLKLRSLSFPAIGTGNMSFPRSLVSSLMLQEVQTFSRTTNPEYLCEVAFVVHHTDTQTVDCFSKEFQGQAQGSRMETHSSGQSHHSNSPHHKSQQSPAFFGQVSSASLGVYRMQMGHLTFEVSSGDITKESSDVIINSSNKDFSLKSGVSKAILDAAGLQVEQECARIVKSPQFQPCLMIMTSAGLLPCKRIIHIMGHNDPSKIKDIVYEVLKTCDKHKLTSVAFPALGTGLGGVSPSAVADAMMDAVVNFVKKKNTSVVKSVKILIFQPNMLTEFYKSMQKRQGEEVEEKGFLTKMKDSVTSFFMGPSEDSSETRNFVMQQEEFDPVVFQLCADKHRSVSAAKARIENMIVKEQSNEDVKSQHIQQLSQRDLEELQALQKELSVSVCLEKKGPDSVIRLEGLTRDVLTAHKKVREMIDRVEKAESHKQKAHLLIKLVEWQYQDKVKGTMEPFDIFTNFDLEEALERKSSIRIKIHNVDHHADVVRKKASTIGKVKSEIELYRKNLKDDGSASLPAHWEDMKASLVKMVTLNPGSPEYIRVEKEFRKTGLASAIIKIERVQNGSLWKNYQIKKKHLENKNKHTNNEKQLFHGTSSSSIGHINDNGFNRSYAGQHGAAFGNGSYFAVDPSYSANGYAKPDAKGHKRMYLALVLVGDHTLGNPSLIVPPAKSGTTDLYDSVTDNGAKPTMFVIFNDVQAYPEFLITFM
ncbi:protein mono-ADP-ribosyltransferase PARP14-like isoform X1 [Osmerus mordax]|uniref:protein mono-ADP-ribosyltransferase PARP14-like isoform X1 n=1 Tax=Osmerus mordax TaxID=8014 RepID=UPI0035100606